MLESVYRSPFRVCGRRNFERSGPRVSEIRGSVEARVCAGPLEPDRRPTTMIET